AHMIIDLYNDLNVRAVEETRSQFAVAVLDQLFRQPVVAGSALVGRKGMPSKPVIMGILKIVRVGSGRRPQVYSFPVLVNLCEGRKVM
ncbi:MAG TPA: Fic family protein, partial [Bacteroidota bacterium]|nr:Fic family protein [Bacteroidota bacterium]